MANLSKEQKQQIVSRLDTILGRVYLKCDDHFIIAQVQKVKMKLLIAVFIDGYIKSINTYSDREDGMHLMTDLSRRFYCIKKKRISEKQKRINIKVFGKKEAERYNCSYVYTTPFFSSPKSFVNHIVKHNESITVLSPDEYSVGLSAKNTAENQAVTHD